MPRKSKSSVLIELGKSPVPEDEEERDEILRKAIRWISRHDLYVPMDVEEDVNISYADDTLDEFRETVRGWLVALREAS